MWRLSYYDRLLWLAVPIFFYHRNKEYSCNCYLLKNVVLLSTFFSLSFIWNIHKDDKDNDKCLKNACKFNISNQTWYIKCSTIFILSSIALHSVCWKLRTWVFSAVDRITKYWCMHDLSLNNTPSYISIIILSLTLYFAE